MGEQTAAVILAQTKARPDVPTQVPGMLIAVQESGGLLVDVGGDVVRVAQDRRLPAPALGPVVLLYATGAYTLYAAPGVPAPAVTEALTTAQRTTVSNDAPSGSGWEDVSATWARTGADGILELWHQRTVAAPPPPVVTDPVTVTAVSADSYRSGSWRSEGRPIHGDASRYGYPGENVGLWLLDPDALALVQAGTWSRATVTVHRDTRGGVYGQAPVTLYTNAHTVKPAGAPGADLRWDAGTLAVDEAKTWDLPVSWLVAFTAGDALGVTAKRSDSYVIFRPSLSLIFYP